ncbi:hypothetical protein WIW50_14805 [Flavobacteriaceae bacterium 3-367]|uniref:hypothetical protein n=1 Tax=Eudoraea algarum TaxID=3417568 RepID=UPI00327A0E24
MDEILKYENREKLYKFLVEEFSLVKKLDRYNPDSFGNFLIVLEANDFLLTYVNDRSFLTINIASKLEPDNGFALSFVRDFLYNPDNMNADEQEMDNVKRIEELNSFLRRDFAKISELFNAYNYPETKRKIDELLKQQFKRRYPDSEDL